MHHRTLRAVWEDAFRSGLTRPGFENLIVILSGWVLTQGTHAVTEALVATQVAGRRHWEAFHRFFSRGSWDPDVLGEALFRRLSRHLGDGALRAVIDDTLASKKGPQVFGIGSHLDAVRSTKRRKVFSFGHCWVVLAVLMRVPFSRRTFAVPLLFRLYRTKKSCSVAKDHLKKTELAREMLDILIRWVGDRRIELTVDSAYCNSTVCADLPSSVVIFGAMRPDAALTAAPDTAAGKRGPGRPRVRGHELRKPEQLARDQRTAWKTVSAWLYGRQTTVRYKTLVGQWYRATGTRVLRIVVVQCTTGKIPVRVFFSTDATLDVTTILETYAGRWGIEVFFRDAKQLLGFADSRARKKAAVLRVAPLIGMLYSTLIIWFAERTHLSALATPPIRPWYPHKRGLAFADVLRAAQRALKHKDILDLLNDYEDLDNTRPGDPNARDRGRRRAA